MGASDGGGEAPRADPPADIRKAWEVLASILHHAPDFLAHISVDGRFLFLNRYIPGLEPAEVMRRTIYDFTEPAYHERMRAAIARVVETRSQQAYETVGVGPDQQPANYFTRVAPVLENGVVSTVVLISTDVTRLKQAQAAHAESEATLKHVLSATGMGTWWWEPALDQGGQDAVTAEIFGTPQGSMTAAQVLDQIHPDDRARVAADLEAVAATGIYTTPEHRMVRPDGSIRWVSVSGQMLGGRLVGGVIDVTSRKRLELQLAQAQKLESVGRLAGGIAHDFNNMLTAILSYTEFAASALPAGSPIASDLAEIRKAADRSVALTSQLLAFARQQVIEPRVIDLNAVVRDIDNLLRRVLSEDIEVVTVLAATRRVKIDPNQFEQVLVNLATNARDAMPDGGRMTIETADVELGSDYAATHPDVTPGPHVVLAVSDSGTGIASHDLAQIFEPFFTTKGQGKGTGLGLAMVYGVVKQNGGHITVYSELGHGTTFKIFLPLAAGELAPQPTSAAVSEGGGVETILLAEDEEVVRAIAMKTLVRAGYRVLEARTGVEALEVARAHGGPIHLLLTDVVMPKMGGKQLAQELALERPTMSVLFVSGYTDNTVVQHGVLDQGVAFLQKPFTPSILVDRVRMVLERRR